MTAESPDAQQQHKGDVLTALGSLELNSVVVTPLKTKRRLYEEDYTPRSRHVDKKAFEPIAQVANNSAASTSTAETKDEPSHSSPTTDNAADPNRDAPTALRHEEKEDSTLGSDAAQDLDSISKASAFNASASMGSIMSHADLTGPYLHGDSMGSSGRKEGPYDVHSDLDNSHSELILQRASRSTPARARSTSPIKVDRSVQTPQATPRATIIPARLGSAEQSDDVSTPRISAADLLYFQTPMNRNAGDASHIRRMTTANGEEMLLDITPRVYSPRSVPIYTLRDLDRIKADFDEARQDLENKVQILRQELAQSISNATHHKALAAQGESLHTEYSKKHVRKVTALKSDWERKSHDRLALKDNIIADRDKQIAELEATLSQERLEKKEVIEMAEAVLKMAAPTEETT